MVFKLIIVAFYLALPAYVANMAPAPFYKLFNKVRFLKAFNAPVNRFLFGDHKTWQGILTGTIFGLLAAALQGWLYQYPAFKDISLIVYPYHWITFGWLAGLGAMLGDLAKSFLKRRLRIPPGDPLPVADQLDFIIGFLLLTYWLSHPDPLIMVTMVIITLILHPLTNIISYLLKIKTKPW